MSDVVDVAAVMTQLYNILKPLAPIDRKRVVKAALALLDDNVDSQFKEYDKDDLAVAEEGRVERFSPKVRTWMQKNDVTSDHISSVFHIDGEKFEIIAGEISGKSAKEKAINAYVLVGIGRFIVSGDSKFDDKIAREACATLGVYDSTNHAKYIKDKGNVIGGSKSTGWSITAPGLKSGAEILKALAGA